MDAAELEGPPGSPNRVYKIVFVGDSGVGKSSVIHRFCYDQFRTNFSATIGKSSLGKRRHSQLQHF